MIACGTTTGKSLFFPDPTAIEWAAGTILEAADRIRSGEKLDRKSYLAVARAALRAADGEKGVVR